MTYGAVPERFICRKLQTWYSFGGESGGPGLDGLGLLCPAGMTGIEDDADSPAGGQEFCPLCHAARVSRGRVTQFLSPPGR